MRVVVADDTDDIRLLMRLVLGTDSRFELVGEAADGEQVIDLCDQLQPDVVLLDLQMPVLSGDRALPLIRQKSPDTAVVVYSAYVDSHEAKRLMQNGASAVITKTSSNILVLDTLAEAARSGG